MQHNIPNGQTAPSLTADEEILTTGQLAARLQLTPRAIQKLVRQRLLPAMALNRKLVRFHWGTVKQVCFHKNWQSTE
ncbi:MAG: hypothetical protein ACYDC1_25455 [Limisphaerales bacterium]